MVPGSTLRYGSNFCSETVRPRLSSRHPIDAAAMPLPREETTPPVTKIYLPIRDLLPFSHDTRLRGSNQFLHALEIARGIDSQRFVIGLNHADLESVFQRPQLLQAFGTLKRPNLK